MKGTRYKENKVKTKKQTQQPPRSSYIIKATRTSRNTNKEHKRQRQKSNVAPTLLSTHPHFKRNQPPPRPPYSLFICNNILSLVQIRLSCESGSLRNDDTFNSYLGSGTVFLSQYLLPPARHQLHLLI